MTDPAIDTAVTRRAVLRLIGAAGVITIGVAS